MPALLDEHQQWLDEDTQTLINNGSVYIGARNQDPTVVVNQLTLYSNSDLTTVITNPQTTNQEGRTENKIYIAETHYSIRVNDQSGTQKYQNLDVGTGIASVGERNLLIGGDLTRNPWQRGTSFTVTTSNTYFADRHVITFDGTANITANKVALATPQKIMGVWCVDALKITINSKSGNTFIRLAQRIEDVTALAENVTLLQTAIEGSGIFTVPLQLRQDFGSGGSPSSDVETAFDANLSVTASLQLLTSGITTPSLSSKTLGANGLHTSFNAVEYDLINVPAAGYVIIPIHQFAKGAVARDFEQLLVDDVVIACQRYFEKSMDMPRDLDTTNTSGVESGRPGGGLNLRQRVSYAVRKRIGASVTTTNPYNSGATGQWRDISDSTNRPTTITGNGDYGFVVSVSGGAEGDLIEGHWYADADIY